MALTDDERTAKLKLVLLAMLEGKDVWVWSKLGYWVKTQVTEIRLSGVVHVRGVGANRTWSFEPGQVRLDAPPDAERKHEVRA